MDYVIANTFTSTAFGGNRLAVFPEAEGLSTELMHAIARELNFGEAVFVTRARDEGVTRDIRIFNTEEELPFAGHVTVGTAVVLITTGALREDTLRRREDGAIDITLGEKIGPVPVRIMGYPGATEAVLTAPRLPGPVAQSFDTALLARVLGLSEADIASNGYAPGYFSAGMPFTVVPVRDRAALSRIRIDFATWSFNLRDSKAPRLYVFTREDWGRGGDVHARMFAPANHMPEDPAAGGAAVAFAGYLADRWPAEGTTTWLIHQGVDMGRPSRIRLEIDASANSITSIRVGGATAILGSGRLDLPPDLLPDLPWA